MSATGGDLWRVAILRMASDYRFHGLGTRTARPPQSVPCWIDQTVFNSHRAILQITASPAAPSPNEFIMSRIKHLIGIIYLRNHPIITAEMNINFPLRKLKTTHANLFKLGFPLNRTDRSISLEKHKVGEMIGNLYLDPGVRPRESKQVYFVLARIAAQKSKSDDSYLHPESSSE